MFATAHSDVSLLIYELLPHEIVVLKRFRLYSSSNEHVIRGNESMLKAVAFVLLCFTVVGICVAPTMGQGVTEGYTVYISFFYPLHFLYNLQVKIEDQTGTLVGHGFSADGSMVVIPVRTEALTISLTAIATGYASGPLTNYLPTPGFSAVSGKSTIPVEEIGGDYWITIILT